MKKKLNLHSCPRLLILLIIQVGDNFDSKYCNAQEKIGNNTREKYDQYLRDESYKDAFKDFYYYHNNIEPNDKFNTKERKFVNPHLQIQSNSKTTTYGANVNSINSYVSKFIF